MPAADYVKLIDETMEQYAVEYLTFSGENPSTENFQKVKRLFQEMGVGFKQVLLPEVDVLYEEDEVRDERLRATIIPRAKILIFVLVLFLSLDLHSFLLSCPLSIF